MTAVEKSPKKKINNFQCAYTEIWPIEKLNPHPENTNYHPPEQIALLAKVIDYQGQRLAVKVSKQSGFITAGHCRLSSIKELGWTEVAVDLQSYEDKAQEIADLNADNKVAELAKFDDSAMIDSIKGLDLPENYDMELFGLVDFNLEEIEPQVNNTNTELNLNSFDNFDHECPKCNFEWNDV